MNKEGTALSLNDEERQILLQELSAIAAAADPVRRAAYEELASRVREGFVTSEDEEALASVVAMLLETGRVRRRYRAEGERILTGLFRRLPAGRELEERLEHANTALAALAGKPLRSVRVGMRTVGHYTVALETEAGTITLAIRPAGIEVESLAVG